MNFAVTSPIIYLETIVFVSVIALNLVKKNSHMVIFYILQSSAVIGMLFLEGINKGLWDLVTLAVIIFAVKVVLAPYLIYRFVKRSHMNFQTSTYLSLPVTLTVMTSLIFLTNSDVFTPLSQFLGKGTSVSTMLASSIMISIFILVNRKGSLSQVIGILSLENTIVAFGFFLELTQIFVIEIGILFDILVWVVLSITFAELIYRHLKSVDVTILNKLKE